ncbi:MAG: hypothetical protein JWR85_1696 [Marmoricola sp.]|nr:hypothetical protein [Marmoricola sp.]
MPTMTVQDSRADLRRLVSVASVASVASVVVVAESTCVCGQALEWSHMAHCPRCGVTRRPR